jgi:hypothetical protein
MCSKFKCLLTSTLIITSNLTRAFTSELNTIALWDREMTTTRL